MRADWTPLFWEPVEGTGERLTAGVVLRLDQGRWGAYRLLRDDVLDCLFGRASSNPRALIDRALNTCAVVAEEAGIEVLAQLPESIMGMRAGRPRSTEATSLGDALRQAVLLHASISQLDGLDDEDIDSVPANEEVNKRFATEVRDAVLLMRPDLVSGFGRSARLIDGGQLVRFGYFSPSAVLHFSVLHPVRQRASVRDARAKLWELARAKAVAGIARAALITAVPRDDEPTLGSRQRQGLRENRVEIEREADAVEMRLHAVGSAVEGAEKVIELVT